MQEQTVCRGGEQPTECNASGLTRIAFTRAQLDEIPRCASHEEHSLVSALRHECRQRAPVGRRDDAAGETALRSSLFTSSTIFA